MLRGYYQESGYYSSHKAGRLLAKPSCRSAHLSCMLDWWKGQHRASLVHISDLTRTMSAPLRRLWQTYEKSDAT